MPWAPELFSASVVDRVQEKWTRELETVPSSTVCSRGSSMRWSGRLPVSPSCTIPYADASVARGHSRHTSLKRTRGCASATSRSRTSTTSSRGDAGSWRWFFTSRAGPDESIFRSRWCVPRTDIAADALHAVEGQTFCPYKGLASYYDIGEARNAAWSYRAPFDEVARIADLVSFYPKRVAIMIDGEKLEEAPGQNVIAHGPDRNLSVDEIGGIQLAEEVAAAGA